MKQIPINKLHINGVIFSIVCLLICIGPCNGQSLEQRYFDLLTSSPYIVTPTDDVTGSGTNITEGYLDRLALISEKLPKNAQFGSFIPEHRSAVRDIMEIILERTEGFPSSLTVDNLFNISNFLKTSSSINSRAWFRALSIAQLLRAPNLVQVNKPSSIELFPTLFFPTAVLEEKTSKEECALWDEKIGADNGFENRLWYFRENIQLNSHHWNWHLRHPTLSNDTIDRRGESFYFFHHELLARYNAERIANGLQLTEPLNMQLDTVLEGGYKPHLKDGISGRPFVERKPFTKLFDGVDENGKMSLKNLTIERDRVLDAINQAGVLHRQGFVEIHHTDRINILGDLAEASVKSINPEHYGEEGYHGRGHVLMGTVDAPVGSFGVIIDLAATMRDPMFYRWHTYIDLVFQAYKLTLLKPYTPHGGKYPLAFKGVKVNSVQVAKEVDESGEVVPANQLDTFWNIRRMELSGGIDFNPNGTSPQSPEVNVCVKHLDHSKFYYEIEIENTMEETTLGTIRIFMAPRFKSIKKKTRYTMAEQRSLFFSMDSFQSVLEPGKNVLVRRSIDSSLTADWPKSNKELKYEMEFKKKLRTVCECGFPQHLLLPKGTEKGMVFDLFVMITNGLEDAVRNNATEPEQQDSSECPPSHIHCGLPGKKYPDSKPMGYPFDRRPYSKPIMVREDGKGVVMNREVHNLEAYVRDISNMYTTQVTIQHHNELRGTQYYEATEEVRPLRLKKF